MSAAQEPRLDGLDFPDATRGDEWPVRPELQTTTEVDLGYQHFGLEPLPWPASSARNALLLSITEAHVSGGSGVHYSRDRNWYARHAKTLPGYFTYRTVVAAANSLASATNLFVHIKAPPADPRAVLGRPRRSVLAFATPPRPAVILSLSEGAQTRPADWVILRDARKRPKSFTPTPLTIASEQLLQRHSELISGTSFTIDHPMAVALEGGCFRIADKTIYTTRRALVRIFNRKLNRGGRFYRGFWLNLPKQLRGALRIDGQPVFEYDYACCHLRLLYGAAELPFPFDLSGGDDPFTLDD